MADLRKPHLQPEGGTTGPFIFDSHDLDEEEMDEADVEEKDQASIKKTTSTVDIRGSLPVVLFAHARPISPHYIRPATHYDFYSLQAHHNHAGV